MTATLNETSKYVGIADAHGIESFVPSGQKDSAFLYLRASMNRQRHAVYFEVELKPDQIAAIDKKLKGKAKNRFEKALKLLKLFVAEGADCNLGGGGDVVESFMMIPNPKLDPWWG